MLYHYAYFYQHCLTMFLFRDLLFLDDFSAKMPHVLTEAVGATLSILELTVDTVGTLNMKSQFKSWADTITANTVFACRLVDLIWEHVFCNIKGSSLNWSAKEESMWKRIIINLFLVCSLLVMAQWSELSTRNQHFSLYKLQLSIWWRLWYILCCCWGYKPVIVEEKEVVLTSFKEQALCIG